jgi:hypothetical protein
VSPERDLDAAERRTDRHETVSTVLHPNGSAVCSFDADFNAAATREVLAMWGWTA